MLRLSRNISAFEWKWQLFWGVIAFFRQQLELKGE